MTLNRLLKKLVPLQRQYGGYSVTVEKDTLWDGNKTFEICDLDSIEVQAINQVDGDGFGVVNKDGSERTRINVVLRGLGGST